jgi:cytochrome bd ubiquinol oxidase subunit II
LILGGGGLFVAFPLAFSILMPALYIPVFVMLLGLILRGVAFEFRWVAKPHHHWWDMAFFVGSATAGFAQGCILGGFLQGVTIVGGRFAGGSFDWLTLFTMLCGIGLVAGYALLGATWLIYKTDGPVQTHARRTAKSLLVVVLLFIAIVSLWTPIEFPRIAERWFGFPNILFLWWVPIVTAGLAFLVWWGLQEGAELLPFAAVIALFLLSFLGLGISNFPYVVPPVLTIFDAAAAPASQVFALIGVLLTLPLVLVYTAMVYWTFRGKVRSGEGYH